MNSTQSGVNVIGNYSNIIRLADEKKVDRIIVALEERRGNFPTKELLECRMEGITVEDGISFIEYLTGKLLIDKIRPSSLIFSNGFNKSPVVQSLKTCSDLLLSLIFLVLFMPLMVCIAVAIKIDSPGPVFYRQERYGRNGKLFDLLKFRSMKNNAEKETGPVWAEENDKRITRIGKIIRKFRLDELPQIINVLKGEMSFIGPRPERPFFVEQLKKEIPYYDKRHIVKPGITGWAQTEYSYGATKEEAMEKLKYDLYYIKNMSLFFDLFIYFRTVKIVLFGEGAR